MKKRSLLVFGAVLGAALTAPAAAGAQEIGAVTDELNTTWIMVAAVLVLLMQAGFMFLEIGFSRGKNVGTGVAKIFVNVGIGTIAWWAIGYGIAGDGNRIFGTENFFFALTPGAEGGAASADVLFGFLFAAVALAILWGTTIERIKFSAYVIFAPIFITLIYPLVAHAVWAEGGLLTDIGGREALDFAGSSVVHLTGATAGLAALLLLGPRIGKYGPDGKPRAIPGHSMPIVGLGVLFLWIGWYGFNAGSTFGTDENLMASVALNTQLAAAAGVVGAGLTVYLKTRALDVGMLGNGAIAGLVGITAPAGYVQFFPAILIGLVAGMIVVLSVLAIERVLDDPVGALSAHGVAGVWGTIAVGLFAYEPLAGTDGLLLGGGLGQLGIQALTIVLTFAFVFCASYLVFWVIKATAGLRVSEEEELAGLDVASHGMYGYPEQFIPQPEFPSIAGTPHVAGTPVMAPMAGASGPPAGTHREGVIQ